MFYKYIPEDGRFAFSDEPREGFDKIPDDECRALFAVQGMGKRIAPDSRGRPVVVDYAPESDAEARQRATVAIRAQRSPILDALDGIAGRADRRGDAATAKAADDAAQALLDITAWPAFIAAKTYDEMRLAIKTRYGEIAAAAPSSVQTAFREVLG